MMHVKRFLRGHHPMSDQPTVDLAYIGRTLDRLTTEVASLRGDMAVMSAVTTRLEGSQTALLTELRAMRQASQAPASSIR
jgi:hypothetical protein